MLGLDHGDGSTTFDGKKLQAYSHPSKVAGILLEAKAFHPTRRARDHLLVLAAADGIPDKRVDEALDTVGLKSEARRRPGKFSLGMSQRLGIAAAILSKPKHLMLDEPGNGLDPEGIAWLRQFIKDYADNGNSVFVSSHGLSEMAQMADNVVVIGKGKLIASSTVDELVSGSAHSSVFVRTSNNDRLHKLLTSKNAKVSTENDGLKIIGATTDQVGKLAFTAGLPVLELSRQSASLEEAFLELTEGSEEFKSKEVSPKKGARS
jgi:ABC-2 type transport system ATP-binding protein